eukprot:768703-Hanusia_phi.AAC.3
MVMVMVTMVVVVVVIVMMMMMEMIMGDDDCGVKVGKKWKIVWVKIAMVRKKFEKADPVEGAQKKAMRL